MKVAILAGGVGTRLAEETEARPKPMVEVGGKPILWHIMKYYSHFGFNDFAIALGYMGDYIKRYMIDYSPLSSNLTVQMKTGAVTVHDGETLSVYVDGKEAGAQRMWNEDGTLRANYVIKEGRRFGLLGSKPCATDS